MPSRFRNYILMYINGERHEIGVEHAGWMLADYLRLKLHLTGTKIVCAEGDCGACTVLRFFPGLGSKKLGRTKTFLPVNSCILPLAQLDGSSLLTVEALGDSTGLSPVQNAMKDCHGSQCGFCTPGFVMALTGLVEKKLKQGETGCLKEAEAKNALTGNLCRCTGYKPIIEAASAVNLESCQPLQPHFASAMMEKELRAALQVAVSLEGKEFAFFAPTSLKEASKYLAKHPEARVLGSSTDLGVASNKGKLGLKRLVSLQLIPELYQMEKKAKGVLRVGARVTVAGLRKAVEREAPELARFLDRFASPQIKNIATLVGNIANASPIADTPPFLLLCDAEVQVMGAGKKRSIPISEFYLDYRKTALRKGELIESVSFRLPSVSDSWALYKVSERKDLDISCVNAGLRVVWEKEKGSCIRDVRVAFGGVAATPLRLERMEAWLRGKVPSAELLAKAEALLQEEIQPISDVRGSAAFRRVLAGNLLRRFFREELEISS